MAEDYYGDDSPQAEAPASGGPAENKPEDDQGDGGKTFLLPSEICPGMKVGDEFPVKVEKVLEDQYEVSYNPASEDKGEPESGGEAPVPSEAPAMSGAGSMYE